MNFASRPIGDASIHHLNDKKHPTPGSEAQCEVLAFNMPEYHIPGFRSNQEDNSFDGNYRRSFPRRYKHDRLQPSEQYPHGQKVRPANGGTVR